MTHEERFLNFLESLMTVDNESLIESIAQGYMVITEANRYEQYQAQQAQAQGVAPESDRDKFIRRSQSKMAGMQGGNADMVRNAIERNKVASIQQNQQGNQLADRRQAEMEQNPAYRPDNLSNTNSPQQLLGADRASAYKNAMNAKYNNSQSLSNNARNLASSNQQLINPQVANRRSNQYDENGRLVDRTPVENRGFSTAKSLQQQAFNRANPR